MTWRVVIISNSCKLDLKLNHLVVRGENLRRIHLSEIAVLILENTAISLTAALLCELSKRKVKVIFCDEKRNPYGELIPYYGSHDSTDKLRTQMSWTNEIKGIVWAEIIKDKIQKQASLLSDLHLYEQSELLETYYGEVQQYDKTNREGHAAKVYFNALFGTEFSRKDDCPINACLNYGYSILLSAFNREVAISGYVTQIGLFHDNTYNPFNLSSDLMEPFRPIVDRCVIKMNPDSIGPAEKQQLADILNKGVMINKQENVLINAIRIFCKGVFDAVNENDIGHMRFYE